jgi:hypothetical protein
MKLAIGFSVALICLGILFGLQGYSAAPKDKQSTVNVAQITPGASLTCPAGSLHFPAMAVTLTTEGGPVQISFTSVVVPGVNNSMSLRPTIDGVDPEPLSEPFIGATHFPHQGLNSQLHFTRIYNVPAGTHVYGVEAVCPNGGTVGARWLSVYELGS